MRPSIYDFNTSNVTIQLTSLKSNILLRYISIHLMLLFNDFKQCIDFAIKKISIHLMLLFNKAFLYRSLLMINISIHLMLLFNPFTFLILILSYHFNTSNVTIQLNVNPFYYGVNRFQYI